jgi:16S rRNA (uracil1498-N3)-methyltransferase
MIRLFVDSPLAQNAVISLDEKSYHYLVHVMRCKDQEQILCFNGQDGEWMAALQTTGKKSAQLMIHKLNRKQTTPAFCALCPALIKKDNMDLVLQKATELGVTDIYPIISDHVVHVHFNKEHADLIVREASEQCERMTIPTIHQPMKLASVMADLPKDCLRYCLAERDEHSDFLPKSGKLAFFVGPEGGWSDKEKQFFKKNNFNSLHFDVGILRAETASIAILSCWQIGRALYLKK